MTSSEITGTSPTKWGDTSFISKKDAPSQESAYNDFFQETSDGNISIGPKVQKSRLELTTIVLGYIVPVAVILGLLGMFHVFIKTGGGAVSIKEKYTFLCPYLIYGMKGISEEEGCETPKVLEDVYTKKESELQINIINKLADYIPIKITRNLLSSSPERAFVLNTYKNKLKMNDILKQFEDVRRKARSVIGDNIACNGISVLEWGNFTTQCTVYGWASGNDDDNGKLGSARIETLRFVDILSDTSKSKFILLNPPTSLSMENILNDQDTNFKTRTTFSIQAQYVPFTEKP